MMASARPGAALDPHARRLLGIILALTALRALFAARVELSPDEAYYWTWSAHLATGYYDHPPLVAWLIRISTWLLGDTELGVRLPALILSGATSWLLFVVTRRLIGDPGRAFWVTLIASVCPLLSVGAVIHTPDAGLVFAWALAIWFALRAFERNRWFDWLGLGAACGLALLAKASGLLLVAGLGLYSVSCKVGRERLRGTGPILGALVAAALAAPSLVWDLGHAGGSLSFQLGHATGGLTFRPLGGFEFLAGQAGVISPILFVGLAGFCLAGWRRAVRFGRTEAYLLWCLSGPVLALTLVLAWFHKVEANWPAVAYLGAVPGMAWAIGGGIWYLRRRRLAAGLAMAVALGLTLLIHLQALVPVLPLSTGRDPTARLRGWKVMAERAGADARALQADLASEGYGPVSVLRFYTGLPVRYQPSATRRSQYDLWPAPSPARRLLMLQPRTSEGAPPICSTARERWLLIRPAAPDGADRSGGFRWWVCEGLEAQPAGQR